MRFRMAFLLLPVAGLMLASCQQIHSGGLGNYYAPGTSYAYDRLNPDDFNGSGGHGSR